MDYFSRFKNQLERGAVRGSHILRTRLIDRLPALPGADMLARLVASFSRRQQRIFAVLTVIFFAASIAAGFALSEHFKVAIPAPGGTIVEGTIGTPRFINPLLAISDAERDLTALVYSGLMRATPEGGLIPDIAKEYEVSEDGLSYTFTLKENLTWHDGTPVTSNDVVFTIEKVQDPAIKSPKRASWEGVSVERIDEDTVRFTLQKPYSPFLENTTIGILPQHVWGDLNADEFSFARPNTEPIGTGPYRIADINTNDSGIPTSYVLKPFKDFALGKPYLEKIRLKFYQDEAALSSALEHGAIEAASAITPERAAAFEDTKKRILSFKLPRVFGVFFNQNQNALFTDEAVRQALNIALDREEIIEDILAGYATPLAGPLPPGALGYEPPLSLPNEETAREERLSRARARLQEAGWTADEESGIRTKGSTALSFSLSTSRTEELKRVAQRIQETWEKLGASVQLKVFSPSDLSRNVIRPREYEALFFGEIIGRESDPFAFWHSSQRNDPGLNISLYANITADSLLEKGRTTQAKEQRAELYRAFQDEVVQDTPAVFVYAPDFIYLIPNELQGIQPGTITVPAERFLDVHTWYINTDRVWRIFKDMPAS